ncbi:MAG: 3-dehydroquinate synthase [Saprospiraceae bacterium]|nr:3-dehydroquinate synthase [Saprospiraceae bacterium]
MSRYLLRGKSGQSEIIVEDFNAMLHNSVIPKDSIYITDNNLNELYSSFLQDKKVISIPYGEENKTISTVNTIYDQLIEFKADRKSFIVGFGGGMITDIAGFVASTYMRGTRFGFIPTSLLAMIDASIGGKNGVNHFNYKNMIGTITQPEFVVIDTVFLKTLPQEEFTNGLAESVKHLLISDQQRFSNFAEHINNVLKKDISFLNDFINQQVKIKIDIVNEDELETGNRKKLNFGHTFGHPIEKILGLKHGFAVSIGMIIASEISKKFGYLNESDVHLIRDTLIKAGLPVSCKMDKKKVIEIMSKDKKKNNDSIDFILLKQIGEAKIELIKIDQLAEMFLEIKLP